MFLKNDYGISGPNAAAIDAIAATLASKPECVSYVKGIEAISDFSSRNFSGLGSGGGSEFNHTSPKLEKAAEKIAAEFVGVPLVEDIAKQLGQKTCGK
jgi:hypothetical protein